MIADALRDQPDMTVTVGGESADALVSSATQANADVVVVGLEPAETAERVSALLLERPSMTVLGLETAAGRGFVFQMRPHRAALGSLAPADLPSVIRAAVGRPLQPVDGEHRGDA